MSEPLETLLITRRGPVLEVLLNRPDKRNAISERMHQEFDQVLDDAEADPAVKVVLVQGAGTVFSAGHDIQEMARLREAEADPYGSPSQARTMPRAWYFRKPLIGAVHGFVGPAAIELLTSFDFVLAAAGTRFSMEQLQYNPVVPHSGYVALFFQLPMRVMEKLWLMGGWMDAEEAHQFQFVQRVVAPELLSEEANRWADQMARVPMDYFMPAKAGLRRTYEMLGLSWMQAMRNPPLDPSPERAEFERLVSEVGMKAALRQREEGTDPDVTRV